MKFIQNFATMYPVAFGLVCIIAWEFGKYIFSLFQKREPQLPRGTQDQPVEFDWTDVGRRYQVVSQDATSVFCSDYEWDGFYTKFVLKGQGVFFKKTDLLTTVQNKDYFRVENTNGAIGIRITTDPVYLSFNCEKYPVAAGFNGYIHPNFSKEDFDRETRLIAA